MIKIYGSKQSSAFRCYWLAEEIGVEVEETPVDFSKGEHKSEAYLKLNPNGKIPTMVDGDVVVWESMAINYYLIEKFAGSFVGTDLVTHAKMNQWTFWAVNHVSPYMTTMYMFKKYNMGTLEDFDKASASVQRYLKVLDEQLAGREFLISDTFTIADLHVCSTVDGGNAFGFDYSAYPNLVRWMNAMHERPAYKKVSSAA